uniref:Uncharacterized protein n=1 Tax=Aegilops tauschii subsp. strangulata TaxID=200361 RepID=A0A453I072_AEGTS
MASDVPMTPELEQIDGEIQDIFRALQNGGSTCYLGAVLSAYALRERRVSVVELEL